MCASGVKSNGSTHRGLNRTHTWHQGIKYINGYDDPEIVAGAGTIGIEVLEQIAAADYVIVPVGGAGE